MKNCPKCNSKNIKQIGPFARRINSGERPQVLLEQEFYYDCLDCHNNWHIKVSESEEFKEVLDRTVAEYRETFEKLAEYDKQ